MKKLFLPLIIWIPILSSAQTDAFDLNDCVSGFEISFYKSLDADNADGRHMSPDHNEIHIIIDENHFKLNNNSYFSVDDLWVALRAYQIYRIKSTNYYFTIGLHNSVSIYKLSELLCYLSKKKSKIPSSKEVKLYIF